MKDGLNEQVGEVIDLLIEDWSNQALNKAADSRKLMPMHDSITPKNDNDNKSFKKPDGYLVTKFPPFWAKATTGGFTSWGWSFNSFDEAKILGFEAAKKLALRWLQEGSLKKLNSERLYYPDRPMREPVLKEIKDADEQVVAVVSRNSYGCEILNTAEAMFVDIDLPEQQQGWKALFKNLFGTRSDNSIYENEQLVLALVRIEEWTAQNPGWGWRVYRTKAGLRLLATHKLQVPHAAQTRTIMEAIGADPLYVRLCVSQKCFRARLTPKPWRCGMKYYPPRWPWADTETEKMFLIWKQQYESAALNYGTCSFLRIIGSAEVHSEIQTILELHDTATQAAMATTLA